MSLPDRVDEIYRQFAGYRCPADLWVCQQCGPEFDFRLSDIKDRLPRWLPAETAAVRAFAGAVWSEVVAGYPPGHAAVR